MSPHKHNSYNCSRWLFVVLIISKQYLLKFSSYICRRPKAYLVSSQAKKYKFTLQRAQPPHGAHPHDTALATICQGRH